MGIIILFYKYVTIAKPQDILVWQRSFCTKLGLKGRIVIAHEGINGTLGGPQAAITDYISAMNNHELFQGIDFKQDPGDANYFPRLRIVVKKEVVHMGIDPAAVTVASTGTHLKPHEAHALIAAQQHSPDFIIFDARNEFEARVGKFTNALVAPIKNFRELPAYIDSTLEQFKDKEVLMYCTGGIRCERASAYLNLKGVAKKVYQIEGGIQRYVQEFPRGFFRGKNYVFDGRMTVKVTDDILGSCYVCNNTCDEYTNCLNASCNRHFICCLGCLVTLGNSCSTTCQELLTTAQVAPRPMRCKIDTTDSHSSSESDAR